MICPLWGISYTAGTCGGPCETHFATMSIFRRIQVFFRGNYFFQPLAPLSVYVGSHPPGHGGPWIGITEFVQSYIPLNDVSWLAVSWDEWSEKSSGPHPQIINGRPLTNKHDARWFVLFVFKFVAPNSASADLQKHLLREVNCFGAKIWNCLLIFFAF